MLQKLILFFRIGCPENAIMQCRDCAGHGHKIITNEVANGIVLHRKSKCNLCEGSGKTMNEKYICTVCKGKKVLYQTKILEVNVDKGMRDAQRIFFKGNFFST